MVGFIADMDSISNNPDYLVDSLIYLVGFEMMKALTLGIAFVVSVGFACEPTEALLDAIEQVESGGDPNAIGDNGEAVGAYQIHKIFVRDVNRILGRKEYEYDDRLDRNKSRQMAEIYLRHYGGTAEEMSRKFNGGPQGHKKESTKKYWLKVKEYLK